MGPGFAIVLVFVGCCSNVVSLELLVRQFPGCGNIVTFAQFVFIALEGFIFETNFGSKKPAIPLRNYVIMVTMFFTVSVINNYALNFNIAMPLHMIFRSGSLIANMILGIIILKKRYSASKYLSVALISAGIFICTIMSARQMNVGNEGSEEQGFYALMHWLIGIGMLTFALLMSARMGIFQETLYKQYGKHSKEALFYNHCLPLPGFLLLSTDIYNHCVYFSHSTPTVVPVVGLTMPIMWLYLLINVITQYPKQVYLTGLYLFIFCNNYYLIILVPNIHKRSHDDRKKKSLPHKFIFSHVSLILFFFLKKNSISLLLWTSKMIQFYLHSRHIQPVTKGCKWAH